MSGAAGHSPFFAWSRSRLNWPEWALRIQTSGAGTAQKSTVVAP